MSFKVLFIYPNGVLLNPPPISIGIFTAILKREGFELDLFDTTLYPEEKGSDESKQENLQARPFNYSEKGITLKKTQMDFDLYDKICKFKPDLIAMSLTEAVYDRAKILLKVMEAFDIPVIAGGVFSTFSPETLLLHKNVKFVCIGEGEETLAELCTKLVQGKDCSDIKNLYIKKNDRIIKNSLRQIVDINVLPLPDYSLFEIERFYRPMAGKVYTTVPVETNRGCPFSCTFCNSPAMSSLYKDGISVNFFRKKNMDRIYQELKYLIAEYNAEYVYFTSDSFLSISDKEFDQFIEFYQEFRLPFWMQTRAETMTEYKAKKLKEIGCHRMSMGLEHGNENFRKKVLKKMFKNDQIIKASKFIESAGIPLTINNIIGFPGEARELIFDTIELNRQLTFDTVNAIPFAPFHGTELHKVCVDKGYITEDYFPGSINVDIPLDMPQLSKDEIKGLKRTFALYARMPKEFWSKIQRAEKFDEEGNKMFSELREIYIEKYF